MPIERSPTAPLPGIAAPPPGVRMSRLSNYPVKTWVFEAAAGGAAALAGAITDAVIKLQAANVPHNMLISGCGDRVFLVPQCYAEKQAEGVVPEHLLATGVNPAVWEITGHMIFFKPEDYENFTQELAWELLAAISVEEERFAELTRLLFGECGHAGAAVGSCGECATTAEEELEGERPVANVEVAALRA
jgi:GDP-L-galactose phosphorylase